MARDPRQGVARENDREEFYAWGGGAGPPAVFLAALPGIPATVPLP